MNRSEAWKAYMDANRKYWADSSEENNQACIKAFAEYGKAKEREEEGTYNLLYSIFPKMK